MRVLTIVVLLVVYASEFLEAQAPSRQIAQPNTSQDFSQEDDLNLARVLRNSYFAAPASKQPDFEPAITMIAIPQKATPSPARLVSSVTVANQHERASVYDAGVHNPGPQHAGIDELVVRRQRCHEPKVDLHPAYRQPLVYGLPAHMATHESTGCETNQYVDPALRRHLMFGVDRHTCCDKWAGFCKCGGWKNCACQQNRWRGRGGEACKCTETCQDDHDCAFPQQK